MCVRKLILSVLVFVYFVTNAAMAAMTTFTVTTSAYSDLGTGPMTVYFKSGEAFKVYHGSAPPALDSDAVDVAGFGSNGFFSYTGSERIYVKYIKTITGIITPSQQVIVSR
jgi:hypothetical protein